MIERLQRLVAIPSLSREEEAIATALGAELRCAGLSVQRQGNNLWCALGETAGPRLLLNSHLDTVPPGAGWSGDPWTPRDRGGRVMGLGANDAKGCVAAMIEAVLATRRRLAGGEKLGGQIILALTAEEENSGHGLGTILEQLGPIDAAVVGEPTALVPMTAQRGLMILRAVAHGKSAHPANIPPQAADNAILTAARDISRLASFDWGPEHPRLGRAHAHVTTIHGGVAHNVIPDRCEIMLDIRTTPAESHGELFARLSQYLSSKLQIHSDRLVPTETACNEPIVRATLRAVPNSRASASFTMSDMVFLADIPSVKIGPGDSRRSHAPDEYVTLEELEAGAAAYERIIRHYFDATPVPSCTPVKNTGWKP